MKRFINYWPLDALLPEIARFACGRRAILAPEQMKSLLAGHLRDHQQCHTRPETQTPATYYRILSKPAGETFRNLPPDLARLAILEWDGGEDALFWLEMGAAAPPDGLRATEAARAYLEWLDGR